MSYIRYKYKIGEMVKIKIQDNKLYDNKIGCIINREHKKDFITSVCVNNVYQIIICGKSDHAVWFSERSIKRIE